MHQLDNEFFETYKQLDRLCSDMYGCHNGVSQYLKDMENTPYSDRIAVFSWEDTYQLLKHLRWVRNQIAHNPSQQQICNAQDIQSVHHIYDCILSQQDPLAEVQKYRSAARHDAAKSMQQNSANPEPAPAHSALGIITVIVISIAVLAIIVYALTRLL